MRRSVLGFVSLLPCSLGEATLLGRAGYTLRLYIRCAVSPRSVLQHYTALIIDWSLSRRAWQNLACSPPGRPYCAAPREWQWNEPEDWSPQYRP